jgi:F0F1-type ATP synthase alpha subunit
VSADGYAGIVRVVDGVAELLGSDQFLRVEGIKMDDGINALVAKCENDTLQLVVNGETVIFANDDTINNGDAGLYVETFETADAAVVFNDFVIIKP